MTMNEVNEIYVGDAFVICPADGCGINIHVKNNPSGEELTCECGKTFSVSEDAKIIL